jgi:hypothetical protein
VIPLLREGASHDLGEGGEDRVLQLREHQTDQAGPFAAQLGGPLVAQHVQAVRTASRVASETPGFPFRTRLTVASDTPTLRATSASLRDMTQVYDQLLQTSCVHCSAATPPALPPGMSRVGQGTVQAIKSGCHRPIGNGTPERGWGHKRGGADGTEGSDGTAQRRAGRRRGAARRGRLRGASVRSGPRRSLGYRRDRVGRRRADAHPARRRPPPRLAAGRRHLAAHGRAGRHPGRRRVALVRRRAPTARLPRAGPPPSPPSSGTGSSTTATACWTRWSSPWPPPRSAGWC